MVTKLSGMTGEVFFRHVDETAECDHPSLPGAMKKNNHQYRPSPPNVWTYTLPGDWTVMAGKSDVDNGRLSLKTAGLTVELASGI